MIHPSDTHPPIKDRMKNIEINIKQISKSDIEKKTPAATELIINYDYLMLTIISRLLQCMTNC